MRGCTSSSNGSATTVSRCGEAERVAGDGDERADLVDAAPGAAEAVAVRHLAARATAW